MIYPFADKLENLGSKYALVVLAAKRAKQVKSGVPPAIDTDSRNPLTIALEEIAMGKIQCSVPDNDLIVTTSVEPEVAQLLAIPGRDDEEYEAGAAVEEETTLAIEDDTRLDDEELLEEWEETDDTEEDEVLPLDKHLENGIPLGTDEDTDEDSEDILAVDEPKPKTRGRRKAAAEPDVDLDVDLAPEADLEDIDLGDDDVVVDDEE